jgi:hypothetical protein
MSSPRRFVISSLREVEEAYIEDYLPSFSLMKPLNKKVEDKTDTNVPGEERKSKEISASPYCLTASCL